MGRGIQLKSQPEIIFLQQLNNILKKYLQLSDIVIK